MNKTLIRAAAVITLVAASITFFACSGEDGSPGKTPQCTGVPVTGGLNIVCDGTLIGSLSNGQSAPGAEGTCTLLPTATSGIYGVQCDGTVVGNLGGGGVAGGCSVSDNPANTAYLLITCGTETREIAKARCGTTAFDPDLWACDYSTPADPQLVAHKCGDKPYQPTIQFCQNGTRVQYLCGQGKEEYEANQFCQPGSSLYWDYRDSVGRVTSDVPLTTNAIATGKIKERCAGKAYAAYEFCYDNTEARVRCYSSTDPQTVFLAPNSGEEYKAGELCDNGTVKGNCGGIPYLGKTEFCQSSGVVKLLCAEQTYTADQFCQPSAPLGIEVTSDGTLIPTGTLVSGKIKVDGSDVDNGEFPLPTTAVANNTTTKLTDVSTITGLHATNKTAEEKLIMDAAAVGTVKNYCDLELNKKQSYGVTQFCQGAGSSAGKVKLLCETDGKEYTADQFCQKASGIHFAAIAAAAADARAGLIKTACGPVSVNDATYNPGGHYGLSQYCSVGNIIQSNLPCATNSAGGGPNAGGTYPTGAETYNPEIEFCVVASGNSQTGKVYDTCLPRRTAPTDGGVTPNYEVGKKACDARDNQLYDIVSYVPTATENNEVAVSSYTKKWLASNLKLNGVDTYNWSTANKAWKTHRGAARTNICPDGWKLPDNTQTVSGGGAGPKEWDNLITALGAGNAGFNMRAANAGWSDDAADLYKFAAKPAPVTGIRLNKGTSTAPEWFVPEGAYAFWWTSNENEDILSNGDYVYILDDNTAVEKNSSNKLTTFLSVRCVQQ